MRQPLRFGILRAIKFEINSFEHGVKLFADFRIPEPEDAITFVLQPLLPGAVLPGGFVLIVMPAIELDDQVCSRAKEIHHIATDRRLRRKCVPNTGSSFSPRQSLRSCGVVLARSFLAVARRIAVEIMRVTLALSPHPARHDALHQGERPSPSRGG